jgi:hypothetical protein
VESFNQSVPITAPQTISPNPNTTQTTATAAIQSHNLATAAMKTQIPSWKKKSLKTSYYI